jgi:hypothetical protein
MPLVDSASDRPFRLTQVALGLLTPWLFTPAALAQTNGTPNPATPDLQQLPFTQIGTLAEGDPALTDGTLYDAYFFAGQAGQIVTFSLTSRDFDTYLLLKDESGQSLIENDDFNGQTDSFVAIALPQDGIYRVLANGYTTNAQGQYQAQRYSIKQTIPPPLPCLNKPLPPVKKSAIATAKGYRSTTWVESTIA